MPRQSIPRVPHVRSGDPAPWHGLGPDVDVTMAEVVGGLIPFEEHPPLQPMTDMGSRPAAVVALLREGSDGTEVLFTRRAWHLRAHRGEMSFPGGAAEDGESLWRTAEREAEEEIGLPPGAARPVGRIQPLTTWVSRRLIIPFVADIDPGVTLVADPGEVDALIWVPLRRLADPLRFREERWAVGPQETSHPVWFFEVDDDVIWGATAAMVRDLLLRSLGDRLLAAGWPSPGDSGTAD